MLEMLFGSYTTPILIGAAVILVVLFLIKFPNGKTYFFALLGIALVGTAIYSGVNIYQYKTAGGGIYGTIEDIDSSNYVVQNETTFEFKNIMLTQSDGDLYDARFETDSVVKLSAEERYKITVNNLPCKYLIHSSDYVICEYKYNFYDENFNSILEEPDTIQFKIAFYEKYTYLVVSTNGGVDAITCWNDYFNKNNFILKIEASDSVYLPAAEYNTVALKMNQEVTKEVEILKNYTYELPTVEDTETKHFLGWSINDGASYIESVTPTDDMIVKAIWEDKIRVTFNLNDDSLDSNSNLLYGTEYYIKGSTIIFPDFKHRHFLGWSTDKETIIDTTNLTATEDVTFYAVYDKTETVTLSLAGGSVVFDSQTISADATIDVDYDEKIIFTEVSKQNCNFNQFKVYINATDYLTISEETFNKSLAEIYQGIVSFRDDVGGEVPEIENFKIEIVWIDNTNEEEVLCYECAELLGVTPYTYTTTREFYNLTYNLLTGESGSDLTDEEIKTNLSTYLDVEYEEDDVEFLTAIKEHNL